MVFLTKAHDFFGERTKSDRSRTKILGQFSSCSDFGLSSLVECDRIASSTNFLARQNTVDGIAYPPNIASGITSQTPVALVVGLLGMNATSIRYCTRSITRHLDTVDLGY
jgi:hypothetical protein